MDFSKALIRCHRIGDMMTDPRGCITANQLEELLQLQNKETEKGKPLTDKQLQRLAELVLKRDETEKEPLSESCITYLIELYCLYRYGRTFRDKSQYVKQLQKGTQVEEDSLDLIAMIDNEHYIKNEERLENEHFTGIPDTYLGEHIRLAKWIEDIKSSWDLESYFPNVTGQLEPRYWWQMQGYYSLTGAMEGAVSFCLVNTPETLINDEKRKLFYQMEVPTDENPDYLREATLLEYRMKFDNIPIEERRVRFYVKRDDDAIERAKKRVIRCRTWLKNFHDSHMVFIKSQKRA